MSIYAATIGVIAGICLGYAILFLFVGIRRQGDKRLNLTFALFAFAYAGTLMLGIGYRSQTTVEAYLAVSRWDGIFVGLAFIALNWFVATYTRVGGKVYLWGITAVLVVTVVGALLTPTVVYTVTPTLTTIPLPWAGPVNTLAGNENIWGVLLTATQLTTLGFIVLAGGRQWRRGERQAAALLLAGMLWFIIAVAYEIVAGTGVITYVPLAETGFLGIAIALGLQMANSGIRTERALADSQQDLEQKVVERTAALAAAQSQLINQAQRTAVAEEPGRIARDLHDAVTQTIYSASLIAEVLPQVWARNPDEGARNVGKLRHLVRGALAEMRTLLFELRPSALEQVGLDTLLPQLADAFSGRSRIPISVTATGTAELPTDVKIAFYRITQEALNNVTKHADATEVTLELDAQPEQTRLCLADNGRGFSTDAIPAGSMGLAIMRERAEASGACLEVTSRQSVGTQLLLTWSPGASPNNGELR